MTLECHKLDGTLVGSKFIKSTKCKVQGNNVHKKHVFTGNCTTRKIFLGKCTNGKNNLDAAIHSVDSVQHNQCKKFRDSKVKIILLILC